MVFVSFLCSLDLCLAVLLGWGVSCLPCESEASRMPESLDSAAVHKHHKMIFKKFKVTEIAVSNKQNLKQIGTFDFTI